MKERKEKRAKPKQKKKTHEHFVNRGNRKANFFVTQCKKTSLHTVLSIKYCFNFCFYQKMFVFSFANTAALNNGIINTTIIILPVSYSPTYAWFTRNYLKSDQVGVDVVLVKFSLLCLDNDRKLVRCDATIMSVWC